MTEISLRTIPGIPLIETGDDLVHIITQALKNANIQLVDDDILVIASKIVSKSEGRWVDLKSVTPGERARHLAEETQKDPRIVELILAESSSVSRTAPNVLVTAHKLGFVSANAGIDQSNVGRGEDHVLLLPIDPDKSAQRLCQGLASATGASIGVVISDSHGRPFRMGNVGVAIGVAGIPALLDLRGQSDLFKRELRASIMAYADLVASAAHLICGEGGEGLPVVLVRGLHYAGAGRASDLYRPPEQDLYR